MKKGWIALIVLAVVVLAGYGWFKGMYNGFVRAEEGVAKAWSDVERC